MNEKKTIAHLKTLRKIDGLNEGLLTIILVFLIGLYIGMLFVVSYTLLCVLSEVYLIERGLSGDAFYNFMGYFRMFFECAFIILVLAFVARCLVKPVYLALSKRKRVV
jgi:hypothetical protein